MRQILLLLSVAFLVIGCTNEEKSLKLIQESSVKQTNQISTQKSAPKNIEAQAYQKEIDLAKLKSNENLEIAKIEARSREEVKRIESEALKAKSLADKEVGLQAQKTQSEIAQLKEQTVVQTQDKDIAFNKIVLIVAALLAALMLLVYFLIHRKNKLHEMRLQEERLKHEASMQENAHRHQKIEKMLDIIADKDLTEETKGALVGILKQYESGQALITYQAADDTIDPKEGEKR